MCDTCATQHDATVVPGHRVVPVDNADGAAIAQRARLRASVLPARALAAELVRRGADVRMTAPVVLCATAERSQQVAPVFDALVAQLQARRAELLAQLEAETVLARQQLELTAACEAAEWRAITASVGVADAVRVHAAALGHVLPAAVVEQPNATAGRLPAFVLDRAVEAAVATAGSFVKIVDA